VLAGVLGSLLIPAFALASTGSYAETRVRGLDLGNPYSVRAARSVTLGTHQGCALVYDDVASGFLLAARGVNLANPARTRHILDGEVLPNGAFSGGHRAGTGFPGKSEFPASWSDDQIMHQISDVATDPLSAVRPGRGGDVFVTGTRDGVDIEVLLRDGEIWTGYPTSVPRNP